MMKSVLKTAGGLFALSGMAVTANAHAVFNTPILKAGEFHTAELRITHGCDGSPTTGIKVMIPEGVTRVTPRDIPGWNVSVEKRKLSKSVKLHGIEFTDTVHAIEWRGGSLPDFAYEQFEFRMMAPMLKSGARPQVFRFDVHQSCEKGEINWTEIPAKGQNPYELDKPAPFFKVVPKPIDVDRGR